MFRHLTEVTFATRWALSLILLVLALAPVWWYFMAKRNAPSLRISSTGVFKAFRKPLKAWIKGALPVLRVLTLALLLLAIARPQTKQDEEKVTTEGIDIVIATDVSSSMLAKDFNPNRLEAAKKEAADFIEGRKHDRMGLVVFGGESFTQCPVTIDHAILQKQLKEIKNGILEDGTAIGMGLATAVQRLKDSEAKSKVIILLTDGVNNRGMVDPITAADIALQFGIRVYTVGVGNNGKAMTPVAMDASGQLIFDYADVQIDEALLKNISKKTGGQYFRATNNNRLKEIYNQIDRLEKTKIEVSAFERKTEKFYAFALVAGILLLLELVFRYWFVKSIP